MAALVIWSQLAFWAATAVLAVWSQQLAFWAAAAMLAIWTQWRVPWVAALAMWFFPG